MAESVVRQMKEYKYTPTLSEKQILYYRTHPVEGVRDLLHIKLIWLQRITLNAIWFSRFPLLNMGRGVGKSYLIAIAAVLFAMLYPRNKIGIIAPVFRQSNYVFDIIDELYASSEYLQAATNKPPSRGSAQSILKFHNGSFIEALPVGDGTKIRGRRYFICFIDEYAQMDENIIKLVIRPMLNIKRVGKQNKLVVASTAYYKWNHFWVLYLFYFRQMQLGNKDYFIAEFDYKDVQNTPDSPYQIDNEIIEMQKNDMTEEEFQMENNCCVPWTTVITDKDIKFIDSIVVGDRVLTHTGGYGVVTQVFSKYYRGYIYEIETLHNNNRLELTPNHPIAMGSKWEKAKNISRDDYLEIPIFSDTAPCPNHIFVSDYVDGIVKDGFFFSRSDRKISQKVYDVIDWLGKKIFERAGLKAFIKKCGITKDIFHYHGHVVNRPKKRNMLFNKIAIDKNFMSLVGWYFAVGNADQKLKFSLGAHETEYINEVVHLIQTVFYITPKVKYYGSGCSIILYNVCAAYLFKSIFGTHIEEKHLPNWVFNLDRLLLESFVRSVWLGNGYHTSSVGIDLANPFLIEQIRQILFKLDIMSSITHNIEIAEYNSLGVVDKSCGYSRLTVQGESMRKLLVILDRPIRESKWYRKNKEYQINPFNVKVPVKEIKKYYYEGPIYNLEVSNDNSYVANSISVHNCKFPSDSVGFISAKLIDQCTPKLDPLEPENAQPDNLYNSKYVLGIDAARVAGGDNFAMVLLKLFEGKKAVSRVITLNGKTFQEMVECIHDILLKFDVLRIHIGGGGGGLTIKDLLAEPWVGNDNQIMPPILDMEDPNHVHKEGMHILKVVNESAKRNNELYMNMKADLQHKRLLFPVDVKATSHEERWLIDAYKENLALKRELMVLEAIPQGLYYKFTVPSKYRKDRATALVMAVDASIDLKRVNETETSGELPMGFFV